MKKRICDASPLDSTFVYRCPQARRQRCQPLFDGHGFESAGDRRDAAVDGNRHKRRRSQPVTPKRNLEDDTLLGRLVVWQVGVEDEVAERVVDQAGAFAFDDLDALEDMWMMAEDEVGAAFGREMREAALAIGGFVGVLDAPMERRHDDVGLSTSGGDGGSDVLVGGDGDRRLIVAHCEAYGKEVAEADECDA